MNFGLTKIKGIITLVASIIGGVALSQYAGWYMCFDCSSDVAMQSLINGTAIGIFLFLIPIYLIWSIFDKKPSSNIGNYLGWVVTAIFIVIILALLFLFIYQQIKYPNIY